MTAPAASSSRGEGIASRPAVSCPAGEVTVAGGSGGGPGSAAVTVASEAGSSSHALSVAARDLVGVRGNGGPATE
jgi:hypothetical protein